MLQAPKRIPRCALTGVPIAPGDLVYVYGVGQVKRRKPRYLESAADAGVVAAPLTLHRHVTEGVGLEYSVFMAAYLNALLDELRREKREANELELLSALAWWDVERNGQYGKNRVYAGLQRLMPKATALDVLEIVMTCHQEQAEPSAIAVRYGKSAAWVYDKLDLCMRIAGYHRDTCACPKCVMRKQQRQTRETRQAG